MYMARTKQRRTYMHLPYIFTAVAGTHLPTPRTKHGVNRMIRIGDIAILGFQDGGPEMAKPEIAPFDPPTPKTHRI